MEEQQENQDNSGEESFGSEEPREERKMYKATCSDCGVDCEVPFEPEEGKPVRCSDCFRKNRPARRFGGGGRRFGGDRSERRFYDATCSDCGKDCQVPFKPKEGSSVRCKDCFIKSKESQ